MQFDEDMVGSYSIQLAGTFERVSQQAREADHEARIFFRELLKDFGKVPGADLRNWLKRILLNAIDNGLMREIAKEALDQNPERFDAMVDAYLSGEATEAAGLLSS